ncbi:Hypothetical predicted protein [Podarcis lilfordi]|uniref:Uncharacterized protein n=1 Tax=Podarcis lilfordi TaxID=74358 RepID=A0AA35LNS5_9SAUR|nr:Hypothetical predicted protein [Podarcis lilfordi]
MKWSKEFAETSLPRSTMQKSHFCFLFKLHVFKFTSTLAFGCHRSRQFYLQRSFDYEHKFHIKFRAISRNEGRKKIKVFQMWTTRNIWNRNPTNRTTLPINTDQPALTEHGERAS